MRVCVRARVWWARGARAAQIVGDARQLELRLVDEVARELRHVAVAAPVARTEAVGILVAQVELRATHAHERPTC